MSEKSENDELKAAYNRGYNAGLRKAGRIASAEARAASDRHFWQQVYLSVIHDFIHGDPWVRGDKRLTTLSDRHGSAESLATMAVKACSKNT